MMKEDEPLLEQMFSDGLSRSLVEALKDISNSVPDILAPIQLRLMSELALVLTGRRDTWDRFILYSMSNNKYVKIEKLKFSNCSLWARNGIIVVIIVRIIFVCSFLF